MDPSNLIRCRERVDRPAEAFGRRTGPKRFPNGAPLAKRSARALPSPKGVLKRWDRRVEEIIRVGKEEEEEEKETLAAVLLLVQICAEAGGGMAMVAMRAMAANLKQKLPVAVQRVFASSRAPATSSKPPTALDSLDPELRRRVLNDVAILIKRNRRNDLVAAGAGVSCGGILISYALYRLSS